MKLGRLNHVGVATPSIADSIAYYRETMGAVAITEPFDLPEQGVKVCFVDTPDGETLVQPRVAEAAKPKAPKAEAPAAFDYSHTPPEELYTVGEFAGRYGSFDESGLPLTDASGEPVSKSQRKKLKKRLDVHAKKWAGAATAA